MSFCPVSSPHGGSFQIMPEVPLRREGGSEGGVWDGRKGFVKEWEGRDWRMDARLYRGWERLGALYLRQYQVYTHTRINTFIEFYCQTESNLFYPTPTLANRTNL